MKQSLIVFLFASIVCLLAFGPKANDPVDNLIASLQRWADVNPQEKVYLHTDKPYYAAGDTIWFKAYVTIGSRHQLSRLSGALYVELIDQKDSLLQSLKLPVTAGMAMGDMVLGDAYQNGNFRLRAYTQWMRNAGEEYFFDKSFTVGSSAGLSEQTAVKEPVPAAKQTAGPGDTERGKAALAKSDVQFFPEGGNMVAGINSRIGFKAVGPNGLGVAVKGKVIDDSGLEVSEIESLHAGMGVFNLLPAAGKNYKALLTFPDNSQHSYELPKALEDGYVLSVYQPNRDSILVRINAARAQYQLSPAVGLIVQSGAEQIFASQVRISKAVNSVWLLRKDFPSGIAQFTLFDYNGQPMNERIAFIKGDDEMKLELKTNKTIYKGREKVELELMSNDKNGRPVAGNFSVSVIDESKTPSDENAETTILSSLLLSSDIKGYIEQPNYYFSARTKEVSKALDNLMLTQGYRRFTWKDLLAADAAPNPPRYKAESLGTEISGRVITLAGKPVASGVVTLMSLKPGFMQQATTDADGRFKYEPLLLADSLRFAVQARTQKGGKKVELVLDQVDEQPVGRNKNAPDFFAAAGRLPAVSGQTNPVITEAPNLAVLKNQRQNLQEVNIRTSKKWGFGNTINESQADQVFRPDAKAPCKTLKECLEEMPNNNSLRFRFEVDTTKNATCSSEIWIPYTLNNKRYTVVIDGWVIPACDYQEFLLGDPFDVDKIYFSHESTAISTRLASGVPTKFVIAVYTKSGNFRKRFNPSVAQLKPKGFNKARTFYAPRYDRPGINTSLPDLRQTVYWNPSVKTLESGRGSLNFFNSDGPGTYKVVVEGINAAGELARSVYRYQVTGDEPVANASPVSAGTTALLTAMQQLQQNMPVEKLYLHTDKPYYNMGDTLWFKAYLLDGKTLAASRRSELLYVELVDDTAEAVRRITIPIKNGIGYGQIPLKRVIFHEGGYTLRAYTNLMQNFGDDYFFSSRFYLGVPASNTWQVRSGSSLTKSGDKDQLLTELTLSHTDRSAVGLREVEARIMEGDKQLYKEQMRTGTDGSLKLSYDLSQKADGKNMRIEIRNLSKADGEQRLVVPINISRNQLIDLQFLPGGGKLVARLRSTVGFKAVAENGKGIQVSGEIYDSKGQVVADFSSLYKGMGAFSFRPVAGETYSAKILQPQGVDRRFPFPMVQLSGSVMELDNQPGSDSLLVDIRATADVRGPDSSWYLVAMSRGIVCYTRNISLGELNHFALPKNIFPGGVLRITLLKGKGPVNERLAFIKPGDDLKIELHNQKLSYSKRDNVGIDLEVRDREGNPVAGNFSVSVTDDSQVQPDSSGNQDIAAQLLIRSELKGNIENPGYYFNLKDKQVWQALNNLLLTQGWKGYDWKDAFEPLREPRFLAERHFKITGMVKNIMNKPVAGAQVLVSSQKPSFIQQSLTDEKGRYTFENLPPIDSGSFFIQARTPKGRTMNFGEITVDRFSSPKVPLSFRDQVLPWYVNTDEAQLNYVRNAAVRAQHRDPKLSGIGLNEVKIKEKKKIKGSMNAAPLGMTNLVLDAEDIRESAVMNLYELLRQKLPGFKIDKDDGYATMKMNKLLVDLVIDGRSSKDIFFISDPSSVGELKDELSRFQVATFRGIEAVWGNDGRHFLAGRTGNPAASGLRGSAMSSMMAAASVAARGGQPRYVSPGLKEYATVYLTTSMESGWYRMNKSDMVTYRPLPLMQPEEFYSPKYSNDDHQPTSQDLRPTIFWKPELKTDAKGKAHLSFYTSDVAGTYTINVQGADMDGKIGSLHQQIKVTAPGPM